MLNRREFADWLRSKHEYVRFKPRASCECPLAEWITETQPQPKKLKASVDNLWYSKGGEILPLPEWAWKFVRALDETVKHNYVSPTECLKILEGVK